MFNWLLCHYLDQRKDASSVLLLKTEVNKAQSELPPHHYQHITTLTMKIFKIMMVMVLVLSALTSSAPIPALGALVPPAIKMTKMVIGSLLPTLINQVVKSYDRETDYDRQTKQLPEIDCESTTNIVRL